MIFTDHLLREPVWRASATHLPGNSKEKMLILQIVDKPLFLPPAAGGNDFSQTFSTGNCLKLLRGPRESSP
jgi:hypothetical protein